MSLFLAWFKIMWLELTHAFSKSFDKNLGDYVNRNPFNGGLLPRVDLLFYGLSALIFEPKFKKRLTEIYSPWSIRNTLWDCIEETFPLAHIDRVKTETKVVYLVFPWWRLPSQVAPICIAPLNWDKSNGRIWVDTRMCPWFEYVDKNSMRLTFANKIVDNSSHILRNKSSEFEVYLRQGNDWGTTFPIGVYERRGLFLKKLSYTWHMPHED